jgi:hypothetical protein
MANEIRNQFQITVSKNGDALTFPSSVVNDMSGNVIYKNTQAIGTSTEAIVLSADISGTPSWMVLKNIDPTNFIEVGLDSASPMTQVFAKLKAGQGFAFPPGTATLYAKADTGACNLVVIAISA